jgi:uncharacterized protein involved in exopolysaccharide biosynthesis
MMIKHYLELLGHYRKLLIIIVATTTLVAAVFSAVLLFTSPLYTATASVVMLPTEAELTFTRGWLGYSQYNPANVLSQTQMEYLMSRPVAEKAFRKITSDIAERPEETGAGAWLGSLMSGARTLVWKVYLTLNSGKFVPLEPREKALRTLIKGIDIEMIEGSYVLQINVTLPNPEAAAAAANALAEAYDEMMAEQSLETASKLTGFFDREVEKREAALDSLSLRENELRQQLDVVSLEDQKQYLLNALEGERQALSAAQVELAELDARMAALRDEKSDVQQRRILARLDEETAMEDVTRTELQQRVSMRQRNIASLRHEQEDLARKEKPLTDVTTKKESVERDVENLRERMLNVGMATSSQLAQVRMINPATVPLYPSFPKVVFNTVVGFMAGILLSFFVLVVIDTTSGTVKTFADLRRLVGARALARISPSTVAQATGKDPRGRKNLLTDVARNLTGHLIGADGDRPSRIEVTGFDDSDAAAAAATVAAAMVERGERVVCRLPESVPLPVSIGAGGDQFKLLYTNKQGEGEGAGAVLIECLSGVSPWRSLSSSRPAGTTMCVISAGELAEEDLQALDESARESGGRAPFYVLIAK